MERHPHEAAELERKPQKQGETKVKTRFCLDFVEGLKEPDGQLVS